MPSVFDNAMVSYVCYLCVLAWNYAAITAAEIVFPNDICCFGVLLEALVVLMGDMESRNARF
jgi:hypothetical protein